MTFQNNAGTHDQNAGFRNIYLSSRYFATDATLGVRTAPLVEEISRKIRGSDRCKITTAVARVPNILSHHHNSTKICFRVLVHTSVLTASSRVDVDSSGDKPASLGNPCGRTTGCTFVATEGSGWVTTMIGTAKATKGEGQLEQTDNGISQHNKYAI